MRFPKIYKPFEHVHVQILLLIRHAGPLTYHLGVLLTIAHVNEFNVHVDISWNIR